MIDCIYEVGVIWEARLTCFTVHDFFNCIEAITCYCYCPFWDVVFLAKFFHYCYHVKFSWYFASVCILVFCVPWGGAGGGDLVFAIFGAFYNQNYCDPIFLDGSVTDRDSCYFSKSRGYLDLLGYFGFVCRYPERVAWYGYWIPPLGFRSCQFYRIWDNCLYLCG